jgi:hypothetical protein
LQAGKVYETITTARNVLEMREKGGDKISKTSSQFNGLELKVA